MSALGTIGLVVVVLVAGACGYGSSVSQEDARSEGLSAAAFFAVLWLLAWLVIAWPVSAWKRDNCERVADGYGLERVDWSFRNGCRIELGTGQLVPEERIRITSEGEIVVVGE